MTTAYNPMYTHRLEPISGFDEITHLQFIAPMNIADLRRNNGSGEEFGLPAGSVVSVDKTTNAFHAGAEGTEMPCFLLWNTSDPDGYPSALTANGQHLAGIAATGAAREHQAGDPMLLDSAELIRNLYQRTPATTGGSTYSYVNADTGLAGAVTGRTEITDSVDATKNVVSYNLRRCAGNFTAWPATCGLELDSTEFDKSLSADDFKANTLLTAPHAISATDAATAVSSITATAEQKEAISLQLQRGGFLTPLTKSDIVASAAFGSATPDFANVCGTVSKGIHRNENGVLVLYFWAERTIFPKVYADKAA